MAVIFLLLKWAKWACTRRKRLYYNDMISDKAIFTQWDGMGVQCWVLENRKKQLFDQKVKLGFERHSFCSAA
jgi:hypothetical protein